MSDDDGCVLSSCNRDNQIADAHHAVIIETAGRFIENVDALIQEIGRCNDQPLFLPRGQGSRVLLFLLGKTEL